MRLIELPRPLEPGVLGSLYPEPQAEMKPVQEIDTEFLLKMFPGKVLFSMEETAEILNVSYEFIRSKVVSGQIASVPLGRRNMINIYELANLTNRGVAS